MMRKTLITGATGGLGSSVVKFLKQKTKTDAIAVLVRDKNSVSAKKYADDDIEIKVGDYNDLDSLVNAFKGIEVLYFVSSSDINHRIPQHKNVIDAAKKAGIKHILYTSTIRKDEQETAPLHLVVNAHKETEDFIIKSGIPYTILRHNLYAEVIAMFIGDKNQLLKTKTIYLPTGNGLTAFVPREDFAEAEAIILLNLNNYTNKILEFNGSEKVSFSEIAEILSKISKEPIQYISPEDAGFRVKMKEIGLPTYIIDMLSMFSLGIANGEFDQETTDLETVLGRKTQSLVNFLNEIYKS
tara:strand:+ start:4712 stop:5605 length:894 start_codon:yes stop_codon:yes gene_type:complete